MMRSIDRYLFNTAFGAFLLVLISLTAIIWITHALRDIDLMTNQGQTILTFLGITSMLIPMLVLVIAPIALLVAVVYTLNKLNTDSELIVMNAAGMSPWRIFRPFLMVAFAVAILIGFTSAYLSPKGLRELRAWAMQVRADLVTSLLQPGRFTSIERGLTFHVRERKSNGQLLDIFVDDRRDANERATLVAERGEIWENERGTFLVLENGSMQRQQTGQRDPTIVIFERYAFDLSRFTGNTTVTTFGSRERYLWDLFSVDPNDPMVKTNPGQFRAELHDRLAAPLYPFAFVIMAYAMLGGPKTNRQSRGLAIGLAVVAVGTLRFIGYGAVIGAVHTPAVLGLLYSSVLGIIVLGIVVILRGTMIEPPAFITNAVAAIAARLERLRIAT